MQGMQRCQVIKGLLQINKKQALQTGRKNKIRMQIHIEYAKAKREILKGRISF
jgi:hypothetical protein